MDDYTMQVLDELNQWKWKMNKKASKMVEATLVGSNLTAYKSLV